jgi:hypothetical protein
MSEYFILDANQETQGPYDLDQIRSMWRLGKITKRTMYAQTGYTEWLPLSTLSELFDVPASDPPHGASAYGALVQQAKQQNIEVSITRGILHAASILATISLVVGIIFWIFRALFNS